jgi:hypothetical protein
MFNHIFAIISDNFFGKRKFMRLKSLTRTSRNQKGENSQKPLFSQVPLVAQYQIYTLCPYSLIFLDNNKGIRAEEDWVIVVATKGF